MFANTIRNHAWLRSLFAAPNNFSPRRKFSIISVHTSFPATLYRFQPERSSGLFDCKQDDGEIEDGLKVATDGWTM
jgi:hypothetical protein